MDRKQMALVALAGGALLALGSVLPWATLSTGLGSTSFAGTEGDGMFTLAFGAIALLVAVAGFNGNRGAFATVAVAGIVALVFVGWEISNMAEGVADVEGDGIRATIGTGLWVAGLGAILAAVGGIAGWRAPIEAPLPPPPIIPVHEDIGRTLGQLADLRDRGTITPEEYEAKKAELLARL